MKRLWCWRCKHVVPMLDEEEFKIVREAHLQGVRAVQDHRQQHDATLEETPVSRLHHPVHEAYERLTGATGVHHDHILYHRLSIYGPPCSACGKPLRRPQASMCAACGALRKA